MRPFTLTVAARSSLLIGGGAIPDGFQGAHVHGHDGRPIIPASALRGALRETLEALLRGADRAACEAGLGHEPSIAALEGTAKRPCELDDGGPCATCRLFGGGREKLPKGARDFSSLVLGDGQLSEVAEAGPWTLRPGVSIGRSHRSAAEDRLFLQRTTATGAVFVAEGWLRDDALMKEFEAAVRATTHIGSGRSRGTARVQLKLDWSEVLNGGYASLSDGDWVVRMTLESPTILGIPLAQTNLRETRREIPGAALRGAIGFALANAIQDPNQDAGFAALVDEHTGAHFGFLSPVDTKAPGTGQPAGKLPLTAQTCKLHGAAHGLYDDLLDRIAIAVIDSPERANEVHEKLRAARCTHALSGIASSRCGQPLRSAKGFRRHTGDIALRVATRASIERVVSSVRDGALFTEIYLQPGTVFEGTIRRVPVAARATLAKVQALRLSIGRARGAGRGRVSVGFLKAPAPLSLIERGERFDRALTQHLRSCQLGIDRVGSLLPLTFLSPLLLDSNDPDECSALEASLPEPLRGGGWLVRARRFVREGTWDQREGKMHAWQAIAAGAVYVMALPQGTRWRDVAGTVERLEREGVGKRRHQGYGEVQAFDPIHCQ